MLLVVFMALYNYALMLVTVLVGCFATAVFYIGLSIYQFVKQPLQQLKILVHDPDEDRVTWPRFESKHKGQKTNPYHVIISGSGFSGLGLAIRLKQEGLEDYIVFERDSQIGGTWHANTYPGCACDIPSSLYSYSWEPNPNWSHFYSRQSEIREYIQHCAKKYNVKSKIQLNTTTTGAYWLDQEQLWRIDTADGSYYCKYFVNANGPLSDPRIPNFPGKDTFKGKVFHSAQWDHNYDLHGKKVVVIGSGASAIQFVPEIVDKVKHITVFQRSAPWVIPRNDFRVPTWMKKLYAAVPFLQLVQRVCLYWFREGNILMMLYRWKTHAHAGPLAKAFIHMKVPNNSLRRIVTPSYALGCKRVLISDDWYPAICKQNATVIPCGVESFTQDGVIGTNGKHVPCDVIILGTGYEVQRLDCKSGMDIRGKDGLGLYDYWAKEGIMKAYKGMTVPNFPNMFFMLGPNTGLGHNSMIYMIESQLNYIVSGLKFMQRENKVMFDPKIGPYLRYNQDQQERLKKSVWNAGGCNNWYLDKNKHNSTIWGKGFTFLYRWEVLRFDDKAYVVK